MTGYTTNNGHQFAVDRLGQLNSRAVDKQCEPMLSQCEYEPRMFSATPAVPRNRGGRVRPETVPCMKHVEEKRYPSHIPGYRPDTHPYSLDILVVFALVEKLQNKVRNLEQELLNLRAKMCHCHDSMNRQMPEADSVTQPNNGDHYENAQSMQASEEISVSPEYGSVDQGSLQQQGEAPAMSAESNGNIPKENSLPDQSEPPTVNEPNGLCHTPAPCLNETRQKVHSKKIECAHCTGTHFIWFCNSFKSLPLNNRWNRARELKLCFRCLLPHLAKNCPKTAICGINHCRLTHNRLLHDENRRQMIWYSRYDTRSIQPPGERNRNQATGVKAASTPLHSLKSTVDNKSIPSGKIFASSEPPVAKTHILNEVSICMPPGGEIGSSLEALATESESIPDPIPAPPGGPLENYESSLGAHGTESESSLEAHATESKSSTAPSSGQVELSDPKPTPPPILKKFADRLRERFKGKHRKVLESFYY